MTRGHSCNKNPMRCGEMKRNLQGKKVMAGGYTCGSCSERFRSICVLHHHCKEHSKGGSFYFDHVMKTAYPKHDTTCSYTQVDADLLDGDLDGETLRADGVHFLSTTAREINPKPLSATSVTGNGEITQQLEIPNEENEKKAKGSLLSIPLGNSGKNLDEITSSYEESTQDTSVCDPSSVCEEVVRKIEYNTLPRCLQSGRFIKRNRLDAYVRPQKENDNKSQGNVPEAVVSRKSCRKRKVTARFIDADWTTPREKSFKCRRQSEKAKALTEDEGGETDHNRVQSEITPKEKTPDSQSVHSGKVTGLAENNTEEKPPEETSLSSPSTHSGKVIVLAENDRGETKGFKVKSKKEEELIKYMHQRQFSENIKGQARQDESGKDESNIRETTQKRPSLKYTDLKNYLEAGEIPVKIVDGEDVGSSKNQPKQEEVEIKEEAPDVYIDNCELPRDICEEEDYENATVPEKEKVEVEIENKSEEHTEVATDAATMGDFSASELLLSLVDSVKKRSETESVESKCVKREENSVDDSKAAITKKSKEKGENDAIIPSDMDTNGRKLSSKNKCRIHKERKIHVLQKCMTCGKIGDESMIRYHKDLHSDSKYICEVCGKEYKTHQLLKAHMRLHGERKFKCDLCPKTFYRRQYWKNHMLIHNMEFPYVCPKCNKGFRESYILKRHMKHIHDNIRNHECDICGEKFFTSRILKVHRIRHYKPSVRCHYCPKVLKTESDRLRHELTHSGEKQFFCPKCSTGFSQLHGYYRHMLKQHSMCKEEAQKIKIRNDNFSRENIHLNQTGYDVDSAVESNQEIPQLDSIKKKISVSEGKKKSTQIDNVPHTKTNEGAGSLIAFIQNGKLILKPNDKPVKPVKQHKKDVMVQSEEDMVIQSSTHMGNEMIIQSSAHMGNELFDHLYVADPSAVTIEVLTEDQPLEEGTIIMEAVEEIPSTGDISAVQQNIVVMSEYPEIEGIEGYTQEYSSLEI